MKVSLFTSRARRGPGSADARAFPQPGRRLISQLLEVCRPVCLADSLQHFDRDDKVERSAHVTMVCWRALRASDRRAADALPRQLAHAGRNSEASQHQRVPRANCGDCWLRFRSRIPRQTYQPAHANASARAERSNSPIPTNSSMGQPAGLA